MQVNIFNKHQLTHVCSRRCLNVNIACGLFINAGVHGLLTNAENEIDLTVL